MAGKSTSGRIILPDLTAAQLAAQNPVLKKRQLQFEGDTGKAKRGDGTTPVSYTHLDVYKRQILRR